MTYTIGIYLFDEVEVLDFAGPFEVFSTASRVNTRMTPDAPKLFDVATIADSMRLVKARGGLAVFPKFDVTFHPSLDVLVVPGGVVTAELSRGPVIEWIRQTAHLTTITASVCTGAFLLGKAGLLEGKEATTHWEDIPDLRTMFPAVRVVEEQHWINTGHIVTSAGISAGIDMSLHLVARLANDDLARRTARQMEFDWHPKTS